VAPKSYAQLPQRLLRLHAMVQLMETVYRDLDLEEEHDHPDNRSWMNLFRHWPGRGCSASPGDLRQPLRRPAPGLLRGTSASNGRD